MINKQQYYFISLVGLLAIVGFQTLGMAQDSFYRSYTPYTDESIFFHLNAKKKLLGKENYKSHIKMESHFINWTELNYFCTLSQTSQLNTGENFVIKPWIINEEESKYVKSLVYEDLLELVIDSQLSLKRLVFLNPDFRAALFERLYEPQFIGSVSSNYSKLTLYALFPFTGERGLIDLFIKSKYYAKEHVLEVVKSPYIPNSYKEIVVDTRDLNIIPALFPNIYTYDKNGDLILVYSFHTADKAKIVNNGYVHYIKTEKRAIKNPTSFYTSALSTYGEEKTDIIISRESYLKFFSSGESIKKLREGNFYIIIGKK